MHDDVWPRIAVVGAGAVGCFYGGMMARAGAAVTLIGRPQHVEAVARDGLFFDGLQFRQAIPMAASTDVAGVRDAALVLVCVKTLDTEEVARSLAPHLAPGAVVLSLQNGVDNVERMRAAAGIEAFPAVVYVAAQMSGAGRVKHTGGSGELIVGDLSAQAGEPRRKVLDEAAALFVRAGVPCRVSDNIAADLWTKMIINCAYNAVSALGRAQYRRMAADPRTRAVMTQAIEEGVAVGRAAGVRFPEMDLVATGLKIADVMGDAISSTAQDIGRGKRTEIDSLNGYVVRRGAELGVATPVNLTLYALVKLLEEAA